MSIDDLKSKSATTVYRYKVKKEKELGADHPEVLQLKKLQQDKQKEERDAWKKRDKEGYLLTKRKDHLRRKYGITLEEYDSILEQQGGVCAICNEKESFTKTELLSVDHCHETGEVRGLLCNSCNTGIGKLKDSVEVVCLAAEYLSKHKNNIVEVLV